MTSESANRGKIGRRAFVAGAGAAGLAFLAPSLVRGSAANETLELGLIGCGGRGNWLCPLFTETGKYRFVACADYFQDRVDATGEKLGIEPRRRHAGLRGYRRLLESKLDAVVIETPPYFHPEQAAAAVEAGKHVFLAKPIAVDVPGCLSIAESGQKATEKKLVFLVDFQTRANELYREALRRVRAGDLGRLVMGEAHYPWASGGRGTPPTDRQEQLRQWYYVLPLSGDFIVEQAIHSLDVATWIADADPLCAAGLGGRTLRPEGSIWDHFAVNYTFPNDLVISFTCIQIRAGCQGRDPRRVFGSEGVIDTDYFRRRLDPRQQTVRRGQYRPAVHHRSPNQHPRVLRLCDQGPVRQRHRRPLGPLQLDRRARPHRRLPRRRSDLGRDAQVGREAGV